MAGIWWVTVLLVVLAGGAGFAAGRYLGPSAKRVRELRDELNRLRKEYDDYRAQVEAHFQETATLFNQLTGTYRSLYEHLAEGAQSLAVRPTALRSDVPEERLTAQTQARAEAETPTEAATGNTGSSATGAHDTPPGSKPAETPEGQAQATAKREEHAVKAQDAARAAVASDEEALQADAAESMPPETEPDAGGSGGNEGDKAAEAVGGRAAGQ